MNVTPQAALAELELEAQAAQDAGAPPERGREQRDGGGEAGGSGVSGGGVRHAAAAVRYCKATAASAQWQGWQAAEHQRPPEPIIAPTPLARGFSWGWGKLPAVPTPAERVAAEADAEERRRLAAAQEQQRQQEQQQAETAAAAGLIFAAESATAAAATAAAATQAAHAPHAAAPGAAHAPHAAEGAGAVAAGGEQQDEEASAAAAAAAAEEEEARETPAERATKLMEVRRWRGPWTWARCSPGSGSWVCWCVLP